MSLQIFLSLRLISKWRYSNDEKQKMSEKQDRISLSKEQSKAVQESVL